MGLYMTEQGLATVYGDKKRSDDDLLTIHLCSALHCQIKYYDDHWTGCTLYLQLETGFMKRKTMPTVCIKQIKITKLTTKL